MVTQTESYVKQEVEEMEVNPTQQAHDEFDCDHEETEIRYIVASNGVKHYKLQCLVCGQKVGEAIPYREIENIEDVLPYDEQLYSYYKGQIMERANEIAQERHAQWQARRTPWDRDYQRYLESDAWKDKRQRVLQRDNYTCKACEKRPATQAHHLTYKHVFNEPLFDLVSVCDVCHDQLTEMDGRGGGHDT